MKSLNTFVVVVVISPTTFHIVGKYYLSGNPVYGGYLSTQTISLRRFSYVMDALKFFTETL